MADVAVLFAARRSIYKALGPALDVYDAERDARTWPGGCPVIAHPPCRSWGRLSHLSKAPAAERLLGFHAVDCVRRYGGVLEHPEGSALWPCASLPRPGLVGRSRVRTDRFGGYTLSVDQSWWGHRAPKRTWLYVVGVSPTRLPLFSPSFLAPSSLVESMGYRERAATPRDFALWLVELARSVHRAGRAL